ncbi:MAG: DNA alkylation repair protein [Ruminococcaceae bacterium]|nr:DNA alkylation repair protein [Oscillospiraceae bacterium]
MGDKILQDLLEFQDSKYKAFYMKLIPNIDPNKIIGIRTPLLKKYAKDIFGRVDAEKFLSILPHTYYEENNLHSFLIMQIKDFDRCIYEIERFLPFVDNWGTCDSLRPEIFSKNKKELLPCIYRWISSEHTYTKRFGIQMLMVHFLDSDFDEVFLEAVADIKSNEYYVNMMIAWFFATALVFQYEKTLPFLTDKRLDKWVHNKTLSKANDSFRITPEQKAFLKTLKI